jgi:putative transposase
MAHSNTLMNQLLVHIPRHDFQSLVSQWDGDRYVKTFTTWNQFVTLLYAQAGDKRSLRDIQNGLSLQSDKLYHLGISAPIRRSTLSDANATRNWAIYQGLFDKLLERCQALSPQHKFRFKNPLRIWDATVIDLCLSMFPWAKFRKTKGALKIHCQLEHAGSIPSFAVVTDGKCHDLRAAKTFFDLIPDSIYCLDKGYFDFQLFRRMHDAGAFFVTRAKTNFNYTVTGQQELPKNKAVLADQTVQLNVFYSHQDFPFPLRLIRFYDADNDRTFEFLTNNFHLAAATIAAIYKARWQIEAFFKWIKQNLKVKTFLGTSKNAVLTQIWVAMCYFLLLAYIKFQAKYRFSLFYLHRMVRETLLERFSLIDLLGLTDAKLPKIRDKDQLCLTF